MEKTREYNTVKTMCWKYKVGFYLKITRNMNNILINTINSRGGAKETLIKVDKFSTNFIYTGS